MIGYIHIYVNGEQVRNWRYFKETLPEIGEEITFSRTLFDERYKVEKIEFVANLLCGDLYRLHCSDLSQEMQGPPEPVKTFAGWFHEIDPVIMKLYPEYKKYDMEKIR